MEFSKDKHITITEKLLEDICQDCFIEGMKGTLGFVFFTQGQPLTEKESKRWKESVTRMALIKHCEGKR